MLRIEFNRSSQQGKLKEKASSENERTQGQLKAFEAFVAEETKTLSSLSLKLNAISGHTLGMMPQGSKIQSISSVAGHHVTRHLSEPSEFTMMYLGFCADYLRQAEPRTESRAVRALSTTGGTRTVKLHGRYVEVY